MTQAAVAFEPKAAVPWLVEEPGDADGYNLVRDFGGLADLLESRVGKGQILDAFLAAAGMNQILEDYLHRDLGELKKVARQLRAVGHPAGQLAAEAVARLGGGLQRLYPSIRERALIRWQRELAGFVQGLADQIAGAPATISPSLKPGPRPTAILAKLPISLRRSLIRLPACFTTFDQHPTDIERLVEDFADRWPDRLQPLLVLGVRTSGSYLAPLAAGFLKAHGYRDVETATWRPEQEWLPGERRRLAAVIRAKGLALVVDDPPTSGGNLAGAAAALEQRGFPRDSVILLFAAFESAPAWRWRQRLAAYESVILPWDRWAIHERLSPEAVRHALAGLLVGRTIEELSAGATRRRFSVAAVAGVERVPAVPTGDERRSPRRHVRARYRAQLIEQGTARTVYHDMYAKGVGLGYLGAATVALAERLGDFLPPVYGAHEGLLFRAWLPEPGRLGRARPEEEAKAADRIASYAVSRGRALGVHEELSRRLVADGSSWGETVWQSAGQLLSPAFGRAAPMARALLRESFSKLLPVSEPSIIDGRTWADQWFMTGYPSGGRQLKVGFDGGAYQAGTIRCYDPLFDVASAAVGAGDRFSDLLRSAYESRSGHGASDEQWLLYRLLAVEYWHDTQASCSQSPVEERGREMREMSRLFQRYFGDLYLGDVAAAANGALCAIDIDGVLETQWLSFPSTTPAGALALRALASHGYHAILVTGRSLEEVRERCQHYRLAGGVAEYGAVVYNHETGAVVPLVTAEDQADLNQLRSALRNMEDIYLDPAPRYAVRAYRIASGRRCGLERATIDEVLARTGAGGRLRPIGGRTQTDFVTVGFNKGTGLRALAVDLDAKGEPPIGSRVAMAVGDTASDLPMFELAARSFAPANADEAVRREAANRGRVTIVKHPHQSGLLRAVSIVLGHGAGGCPTCRAPGLSLEAKRFNGILEAQDLGRWRKFAHLVVLASRGA